LAGKPVEIKFSKDGHIFDHNRIRIRTDRDGKYDYSFSPSKDGQIEITTTLVNLKSTGNATASVTVNRPSSWIPEVIFASFISGAFILAFIFRNVWNLKSEKLRIGLVFASGFFCLMLDLVGLFILNQFQLYGTDNSKFVNLLGGIPFGS
jgi:hypothetical protein